VPTLGVVRVAQLIAAVVTPHRFRSKRQFWAYCGLAVVTRSSADYRVEEAGLRRTKKAAATRGLTRSHNRTPEARLQERSAGGLPLRAVQVVVRGATGEGAAAGAGAGDDGAQDRGRHLSGVEERRELRGRRSDEANRISRRGWPAEEPRASHAPHLLVKGSGLSICGLCRLRESARVSLLQRYAAPDDQRKP